MKKIIPYIFISFFIILFSAVLVIPAIQQISGIAVAQTALKWNNVIDAAIGDAQSTGIMGVSPYLYNGTSLDRARGSTANGLEVDVTRVQGTTTIAGNNTPADGYSNPTDAIDSNSLHSEWNGSTWDRIRHSFDQTTASVTGTGTGTTVDMTTTPMNNYTLAVIRTAGATDAVEIDLECSGDNSNFFEIATVTSVAGGSGFATQPDTPCLYMQYNVVDEGSGNTLTIQIISTR